MRIVRDEFDGYKLKRHNVDRSHGHYLDGHYLDRQYFDGQYLDGHDVKRNELDGYEGGFVFYGPPNQVVHSTYFASPSLTVGNNVKVSAGLAAGFHVYGVQWIPGVSITIYLDGTPVSQVTEAEAGSIPAEPYEIILQLLVASANSRWHTVTNSSTPTSSMQVDEVQAYS